MLLGASAKPLLYLLDGLGVDVCVRQCLKCSYPFQWLWVVWTDIPDPLSRGIRGSVGGIETQVLHTVECFLEAEMSHLQNPAASDVRQHLYPEAPFRNITSLQANKCLLPEYCFQECCAEMASSFGCLLQFRDGEKLLKSDAIYVWVHYKLQNPWPWLVGGEIESASVAKMI
jgi:hypothetical protein